MIDDTIGFQSTICTAKCYAWTSEGCYSEVLKQQAATHSYYLLVMFDACSVLHKHDQDMNAGCTSPLNMGLGLLLVQFSTLQAALQTCHLPIQNLPFAAGLHQLPLKLHATHSSECQGFLSCRAPCGPRSFFRCKIIQNPYA